LLVFFSGSIVCSFVYECLMGTSLSPLWSLAAWGKGTAMVKVPSLARELLTASGSTPLKVNLKTDENPTILNLRQPYSKITVHELRWVNSVFDWGFNFTQGCHIKIWKNSQICSWK
jgi:hypothetical protein